jgi:hypothetical protein
VVRSAGVSGPNMKNTAPAARETCNRSQKPEM